MATSDDMISIKLSIDDKGKGENFEMQSTIGSIAATPAQITNFMTSRLNKISNQGISLSNTCKLTYRQMIFISLTSCLALAAVVLLVIVIIDSSTLAYESSRANCIDYDCYKSASTLQRRLNISANPCENFYQYACGGWINRTNLRGSERERSFLIELEEENLLRLNEAIMGDIDPFRQVDWAYEMKLQRLFQTCLNQYQTTNLFEDNNPVLGDIAKMGGWYILDPEWSEREFDWGKAHRQVLGRDNMVTVFFAWDIEPWDQQHSSYIITIREDFSLPLPYYKWNDPVNKYETTSYPEFIKNVATLLAEDADVKDSELSARLETFINDVITVEKSLAKAQLDNEAELSNPSGELSALGSLPSLDLVDFEWSSYFQTTMAESKHPIGESTSIVNKVPKTLKAVSQITRNANNRQINNYLVWRFLYDWLADMSYEYNHLLLKWKGTLQGKPEDATYQPSWTYCMETAQEWMGDALDGIYVKRHFNRLDKDEIDLVSESIRRGVTARLLNINWMDDVTRSSALEKVSQVLEKLGYPDMYYTEISSQNFLDFSYRNVSMSETDHYNNIQQVRQHYRRELVNIYSIGRDPLTDWRETPLYSVKSTYFYPWNEMIIPAGFLQFPVYSNNDPEMYRVQTFGSAGLRLARGYLYSVSETGKYYDKYGNYLTSATGWWTIDSTKMFEEKKKCFTNWYGDIETDTLLLDNGEKVNEKLQNPSSYASQAIIDIGSLRNAYLTYSSSELQGQSKTSAEKYLPGVPADSKSEYFFLSFAQTYCAVREDQVVYDRLNQGSSWLPEELMVNNLLMHVPEFADVFKCSADSKMNPGGCDSVF